MDVRSRESIRAAIGQVEAIFGGLDILVNNAGVNKPADFDQIADADWDEILAVNLKGPFLCAQEALPALRRRGGGSIVNIGSVSGQYGGPRTAHYAASKAGLISLGQVDRPLRREGQHPLQHRGRRVDRVRDGRDRPAIGGGQEGRRRHPSRPARHARRKSPGPSCSWRRMPAATSRPKPSTSTAGSISETRKLIPEYESQRSFVGVDRSGDSLAINNREKNVDEPAFRKLFADCVDAGVHGIFVGGSAGEGPLLGDLRNGGGWSKSPAMKSATKSLAGRGHGYFHPRVCEKIKLLRRSATAASC